MTGGAGYIGSHVAVALAEAGYQPVLLDNLCNSAAEVLPRLEGLCDKALPFLVADVRDRAALDGLFQTYQPQAVIHCAGLKSVAESIANPLLYYRNNVEGSLTLLEAMQAAGCSRMVFSSSATVYGAPDALPYTEAHPLRPMNPYGQTKAMIEQMLRDCGAAHPQWKAINLRYFNPVGAHPSGQIGEDPRGTPNNLMPYVAQVAVGARPRLQIFGTDWPTPDGTGVRDYIHVMDLAEAHVAALQALEGQAEVQDINVGTGQGSSVLELLEAFTQASGVDIPWEAAPRRPGDLACYFANASLAHTQLNWSARRDLATMCADVWRWQQNNPKGYAA